MHESDTHVHEAVGHAFLVSAVRPLHPEEQTIAEMLQGPSMSAVRPDMSTTR